MLQVSTWNCIKHVTRLKPLVPLGRLAAFCGTEMQLYQQIALDSKIIAAS